MDSAARLRELIGQFDRAISDGEWSEIGARLCTAAEEILRDVQPTLTKPRTEREN